MRQQIIGVTNKEIESTYCAEIKLVFILFFKNNKNVQVEEPVLFPPGEKVSVLY